MRATRDLIALGVACALLGVSLGGCARATKDSAAGPAPAGAQSESSGSASSSAGSTSEPGSLPSTAPLAAQASVLEPPSYGGFEPLPIFTYHSVDPTLKNFIAIAPSTFEAQLKVIKSGGYQPITARQLVDHQLHGTPLPPKPVMITFDDGWRNQFVYAEPLLQKYGFKATFFINPQPITQGYPAYLTRGMVVSLARDGNDIESHTWRHLSLIRSRSQSAATFQQHNMSQLTLATTWIRKVVGQQPVALCYPFGSYDTEAIAMAQRAGYKAGFTVDEGVADARPWDAFGLKRFVIQPTDSLGNFKACLNSAPMPVTDIQPPPATRVAGITTTVSVDITDVPPSVMGFSMTSGPSMKGLQIVSRNGRRYAVAVIRKGKVGLREVETRGVDNSGREYVSSWVIVLGDPSQQ